MSNELPTSDRRLSVMQKRVYSDQLIGLFALLVMSVWRWGERALMLAAVSILAAATADLIFCKLSGKTYTIKDQSTYATGLCLALMCPATAVYTAVAFGAAFAMAVKHIFGGKDNYIFNPTAVSVAFLIICYPTQMLLFPRLGEKPPLLQMSGLNLTTGVESMLRKLETAREFNGMDLLLGNFTGASGTTHVLVLLVIAVCLLCRRSLSAIVFASAGAVFAAVLLFIPGYMLSPDFLVLEFVGGYTLFGLIFLAGDPQTLPKGALARLYYGIILGASMAVFRFSGRVEGSFVFALLIANALSLICDSVARATVSRLHRIAVYSRTHLPMFERFREAAKRDMLPGQPADRRIGDTQEIELVPTNFETPPINNKVTKIKRSNSKFGVFIERAAGIFAGGKRRKSNSVQITADEVRIPKDLLTPLRQRPGIKAIRRGIKRAAVGLARAFGFAGGLVGRLFRRLGRKVHALFYAEDMTVKIKKEDAENPEPDGAEDITEDDLTLVTDPVIDVFHEPFVSEDLEIIAFPDLPETDAEKEEKERV